MNSFRSLAQSRLGVLLKSWWRVEIRIWKSGHDREREARVDRGGTGSEGGRWDTRLERTGNCTNDQEDSTHPSTSLHLPVLPVVDSHVSRRSAARRSCSSGRGSSRRCGSRSRRTCANVRATCRPRAVRTARRRRPPRPLRRAAAARGAEAGRRARARPSPRRRPASRARRSRRRSPSGASERYKALSLCRFKHILYCSTMNMPPSTIIMPRAAAAAPPRLPISSHRFHSRTVPSGAI